MNDIATTLIIWAATTLALCGVGLLIADYIKTRRFYSRFNRKNERQLYAVGTRFPNGR